MTYEHSAAGTAGRFPARSRPVGGTFGTGFPRRGAADRVRPFFMTASPQEALPALQRKLGKADSPGENIVSRAGVAVNDRARSGTGAWERFLRSEAAADGTEYQL